MDAFQDGFVSRNELLALGLSKPHLSHEIGDENNVVSDVGEIDAGNSQLLFQELGNSSID